MGVNIITIPSFREFIIGIFMYFNFCLTVASNKYVNNSCSFFTKTNAQVERKLVGLGFHRTMETIISVSSLEDLKPCKILMKDSLPSGAYVDPNQLKFMEDFGGPLHFIPQMINVEAPEHVSPKIQAYFFVELSFNIDGNWISNISVPIHLRYHRARPSSSHFLESKVSFPHPSLFLSCDEELPEQCLAISQLEPCHSERVQLCDWLPISTFSTSDWVQATVPVGDTDLIETVLLTTTTITCAAMLLLLAAIFKKGEQHRTAYHASVS